MASEPMGAGGSGDVADRGEEAGVEEDFEGEESGEGEGGEGEKSVGERGEDCGGVSDQQQGGDRGRGENERF